MFLIPHLLFLCLYSFVVERYGSVVEWDSIHPDFFLPIFVFILHRSPYPHLVLLVALVGCFADILQGHSWSQLTCLYVLIYLGLDRMKIAQKCSNYFVFSATIVGISLIQPIWLKSTGIFNSAGDPIELAIINLVYSSIAFFIFKLIRLGWGVPKIQIVNRPING